MRAFRLINRFLQASAQQEMAYRANFWIKLLHSLLQLGVGVMSLQVIFSQVQALHGWDYPSALALLGVYLLVSALRGLFMSPSFDALVGLGGDVFTGRFDFTLLRPVGVQFFVSVRHWQLFSLLDVLLGLGVLGAAMLQLGAQLSLAQTLVFVITLLAGLVVLYALLLACSALVFWAPDFLYTWLFDGVFQLARYPVGIYPGWLKLVLTWIIPVGLMTTIPAQALVGRLPLPVLVGSLALAPLAFLGASALFRLGLKRYASASS